MYIIEWKWFLRHMIVMVSPQRYVGLNTVLVIIRKKTDCKAVWNKNQNNLASIILFYLFVSVLLTMKKGHIHGEDDGTLC